MSPGRRTLLGGFARTATVTAAGDVRLLRVDGDAFLGLLTTTPATRALLENARSRLAPDASGAAARAPSDCRLRLTRHRRPRPARLVGWIPWIVNASATRQPRA